MPRRLSTLPRKSRLLKRTVAASRSQNFSDLMQHVRTIIPQEFDGLQWGAAVWTVGEGRLTTTTGRRRGSVSLNFYSTMRPGFVLPQDWIVLIQALMVLRFSARQQSASSQRQFISSAAIVAVKVAEAGRGLHQLNRGDLDGACEDISANYSESSAYGRHNSVEEFVRLGVEYGIFGDGLSGYYYSRRYRSNAQSGLGYQRLDSPDITYEDLGKMVDPKTIAVIGELYRQVPRDHKYRLYILILSFAAILGRRFSEIALLPLQHVRRRDSGRCSIYYFPGKQVKGQSIIYRRKIWLPSNVVSLVTGIVEEMITVTQVTRERARFMVDHHRSDTRFLSNLPADMKIYASDLISLGLPEVWLDNNKWLAKNGLVYKDVSPNYGGPARNYTFVRHVVARCDNDYRESHAELKMTDQHGTNYYVSDLLLIRPLGSSSGAYSSWVTTECTHSMLTTFLRYLPQLSRTILGEDLEVDFTTHSFRHTVSTLLNEGGLSELAQAEFFARGTISENPTYQHQSSEQKALQLRKDLLSGKAKGHLADLIVNLPVGEREAIIIAKTNGFHDVGTGCCTHPLIKEPCPHAGNCQSDCDHLVYLPDDQSQKEELLRQLNVALINLKAVSKIMNSDRPRLSGSWVAFHEKSIGYMVGRLLEAGVSEEELVSIKRGILDAE